MTGLLPARAIPGQSQPIQITRPVPGWTLKQAVPRKAPARSKQQLKRAAISHMRSLSKRPQRIRCIFQHPQFRYAA